MRPVQQKPQVQKRGRGFARASSLLQTRIRQASESRGFAVSRLLTHWSDIVGAEIARMARPVKVGYGREGFGATLTILTTGAQAPLLQADLPRIRDKVNACYGYNAISRIRITQTAPTGFCEGQAQFAPASKQQPKTIDPAVKEAASRVTAPVHDTELRAALAALGENILSRSKC